MSDESEQIRRVRLAAINADPKDRTALEAAHGPVWDTRELARDFVIVGFLAPLVVVRRRADGVLGSLEFQHAPRYYFGFAADAPHSSTSCPWCHASNHAGRRRCSECGHDAHVERGRCECGPVRPWRPARAADGGGPGGRPGTAASSRPPRMTTP